MASFNKVILVGNLVADPELRKTNGGTSVTSFRIAVGRRFAKDGEQNTDFIDVVAWRNTAEFVCNHFAKGKGILVCGSLQTRSWTAQDGSKRFATEVVADEVSFVEKKTEESPKPMTYQQAIEADPKNVEFEEMTPDDDLPF